MSYKCHCCGEIHQDLPDIGIDKPFLATEILEEDWPGRVELTADTCIIDGKDFFIRGVLIIPVHEDENGLGFGVWVSQKKENFQTYVENSDSAEIGPYFGWFANELGPYAPTLSLKTMAHFQGNNQRPLIELEPTDHPLSIDYQNGISIERAWEIVHEYMPA
ncbi:DUF2199 domain-containing protein [Hymenobacter ruricola]|uniref:DUF2199 domain-containing protein n=1 Tax=Hymenobacter ruricola TaxID=2791023 RepID=A0ABS0I502_9BACT|nr:DUF2199 domain-containing protein [Hymenobacter ruricola]MBF9221788.1 DUF2199 domain-containing protein [Hymenobacter ruricola]